MIKIYYDPITGYIKQQISVDKDLEITGTMCDGPYIEHPVRIRMCDYTVDVHTQQLIHTPQPQPSIRR